MDLRYIYDYANEVTNLPEKYKQAHWKKEVIPTNDEKRLTLQTDALYKAFILKTRTLGLDCSFKYKINRSDVILQYYTGTSNHAIVPKFVTLIDNGAFYKKGLTNLSLNDGLKFIASNAFAHNDIVEVDIPKTLTSIGKNAFLRNTQLFKRVPHRDGYLMVLDEGKFRMHSKNTRIGQQME